MAERKCLQLFMGVVCFVAVAVAQNVNVRMPRKNVLSLTDFANVGDVWYEMYFAVSLPETDLFYNVKHNLTVDVGYKLQWKYSGQYYDSQVCAQTATELYNVITPDKANFQVEGGGTTTVAFVSSDPSQYILAFKCFWPGIRSCSSSALVVILLVKSQRPDSFPMMSVINDVKRNTDGVLTFDGTTTSTSGSPLKFFYTMLDENICDPDA